MLQINEASINVNSRALDYVSTTRHRPDEVVYLF